MHRFDEKCHWCGDVQSTWRFGGSVSRRAAAAALMAVAAIGVWRYRPLLEDFAQAVQSEPSATMQSVDALATTDDPPISDMAVNDTEGQSVRIEQARNADVLDAARMTATGSADQPVGAAASDQAPASGSLDMHAAGDSIVWTPAVARTWVNVRNAASRGGEVVGVIKPESKALLGTGRDGWRRVRLSDISGWVDPRLFETDSARTRSE